MDGLALQRQFRIPVQCRNHRQSLGEVKCTKIYKLLISVIYKDTKKRMGNP